MSRAPAGPERRKRLAAAGGALLVAPQDKIARVRVSVILLPVSVAAAAVTLSFGVLMWPLTIKPALRRRYEREHHRRKLRGRRRP